MPHLRSITDTSYFPTDEIDQADEERSADSSAAGKDLAFLGYADYFNQPEQSFNIISQIHIQAILGMIHITIRITLARPLPYNDIELSRLGSPSRYREDFNIIYM